MVPYIHTDTGMFVLVKFVLFFLLQEFVAVRVQDPRIHNEGSWNSFVDYKIFLHVSVETKLQFHGWCLWIS